MCGINGIYTLRLQKSPEQIKTNLQQMNTAIAHRGPDADGFFFESEKETYSVGLAHRRLAVIDIENGQQPIFSADKQKLIVYNGEVYNYKELKKQYFTEKDIFETSTDTEVVLKLYEKLGTDAFGMLEGMFAFSIYDRIKQKIYIARDFFGEKPLYFTQQNDAFYWASELKSIVEVLPGKPEINREGLNLYFRLCYIPAPYTIYSGIYKLEANHFLEIDCTTGKVEKQEIKTSVRDFGKLSFEEAKQKTAELVNQSVASRLVADVPVGAFLSGGVDSSVVSLCASRQMSKPINTFSIGFEKKEFDETDKARVVSGIIGSNHHELIIGESDLLDVVDKIVLNFDEPFADSSALPSYMVAHYTSQSAKVALTGDGGDEVFGGYNKYYMGKLNSTYTAFVPQALHKGISRLSNSLLAESTDSRGLKFKLNRLIKGIDYNSDFYFNIVSLGFMENEAVELLNNGFYQNNPLLYYKKLANGSRTIHDFRQIDRLLSLEGDMNVKVDRTAMLTSIETRAPFLNKGLWDFSSQLPERFLMKGMNKKYILKKAFENEFPKGFLDKSKKGFGVPVGDWLRNSLKEELLSYMDKDFLRKQAIFNINFVETLIGNHLTGKQDNTFRVWTYFCFQKWYKNAYGN